MNALMFALLLLAVAPGGAARCAQTASQTLRLDGVDSPSKREWVTFLGPASQAVVAGKNSPVLLRFRIAEGLHINSHRPTGALLIPTNLVVIEERGLDVRTIDFPPGEKYSFAFDPKTQLDVFTGELSLSANVVAARGEHSLQAVLRYQACDHAACYPPKTLPLTVKITAR